MKAITLHQPWASMIFDVDQTGAPRCMLLDRSFGCDYKEPIAIHASAVPDVPMCLQMGYDAALIPRAAVLGVVRVLRSDRNSNVKGRFIWKLEVVKKFAQPVPARGARLLWNWDCP